MVRPQSTHRPLVFASILLGIFLAAIEATIVSTAMPSIVADLGSFSLYSWVFSAYLLSNGATVLVFGKLSDVYGRKPIYVLGVILFLTGSTLAGFSTSMVMLIIARFIQGVGAGALMPLASTLIGDLYQSEGERAKRQGYVSAMYGISAVTGPLLGGVFVDVLSWRFVFWMNIPLGLLAMLGIVFFLHEDFKESKQRIDYVGALWIMLAVGSLIFILVEGGIGIDWNSYIMYGLILLCSIGFGMLLWQSRHSEHPIIPLDIWKSRMILIANLTALTTGMVLMGITSYIPTYVQGVMGYSATIAGYALTTMSIGWPIAAHLAGRFLPRIGTGYTVLLGGVALLISGGLYFLLTPEKGPFWVGAASLFFGFGMGLTSTSFLVGVQGAVDRHKQGTAMATYMFMRSLGSAVGVALLGGLLNGQIKNYIKENGLEGQISLDSVKQLLDGDASGMLSAGNEKLLLDSLTNGLHFIFAIFLLLAVISFICILAMPKGRANQDNS